MKLVSEVFRPNIKMINPLSEDGDVSFEAMYRPGNYLSWNYHGVIMMRPNIRTEDAITSSFKIKKNDATSCVFGRGAGTLDDSLITFQSIHIEDAQMWIGVNSRGELAMVTSCDDIDTAI